MPDSCPIYHLNGQESVTSGYNSSDFYSINNSIFLYRGLGHGTSSCNVVSRVKRMEKGATRLEMFHPEMRRTGFFNEITIKSGLKAAFLRLESISNKFGLIRTF